jgi:hypothetical protein
LILHQTSSSRSIYRDRNCMQQSSHFSRNEQQIINWQIKNEELKRRYLRLD